MSSTKVRFDRAPTVLTMIVRMSFKDFHDLANLNTLSSLKDLSMESPDMPSARISTKEKTTIMKSKTFHPF